MQTMSGILPDIFTNVLRNTREQLSSSIGKHLSDVHHVGTEEISDKFSVLRKCKNKFDCLVYEMLYIRDIKPSLNVQSDSISAKLFK